MASLSPKSAQKQALTLKAKGFTLIELLVVIAIIAILASILFPVFARARENARRSSCLSNLKQIGLGVMQYTQDYDEQLPYVEQASSATPGNFATNYTIWAETLTPYLKSTQIWYCPSNSTSNTPKAVADVTVAGINMSYGAACDRAGGFAFASQKDNGASNLAQFNNSAETILLGDRKDTAQGYGYWVMPSNYTATGPGTCCGVESSIHLEGGNYAFADGHAKWMRSTNANATINGTPFYLWLRVKP
jgi:prepilin-type N-terminal cleavage/methylation domain-containing protein/prepilin-type processing-associated H-X9-DG protein